MSNVSKVKNHEPIKEKITDNYKGKTLELKTNYQALLNSLNNFCSILIKLLIIMCFVWLYQQNVVLKFENQHL